MSASQPMNAADAVLQPALEAGYGAKPALKWRDETVSYDQLAERTLRAAAVIRAEGVEPEQRVALLMKDYPGLVYALSLIHISASEEKDERPDRSGDHVSGSLR